MTNEIGRELLVSELVPRTVVVLTKEGHPMAATAWVNKIEELFVFFGMGEIETVLAALRDGDCLTDDTGNRIHVYEYLGKI